MKGNPGFPLTLPQEKPRFPFNPSFRNVISFILQIWIFENVGLVYTRFFRHSVTLEKCY